MRPSTAKLLLTAFGAGLLLIGVFVFTVLHDRTGLGAAIRSTIIGRDAAVLHPVALQQLSEARAAGDDTLTAVLRTAHQDGMLAVALFDANGRPWRHYPASLLLADLPLGDLLSLQSRQPISRFYAQFPLGRYFAGIAPDQSSAPVLEILLPLYAPDTPQTLLGFAQYFIDARPLAEELNGIDRRIHSQTVDTLLLGSSLIAGLFALGTYGFSRARRLLAERNARLIRANFELTLSAKTSALGQITSHLIHGLQGPVAGLRAAMAGHSGNTQPDWQSATDYTERLQSLIHETVALLGDTRLQANYELTGNELAAAIRERNSAEARTRGVAFTVSNGFSGALDSHRGGLLCLIASNLVQNAFQATPSGRAVAVRLDGDDKKATLTVSDEGPGIPPELVAHLYEPGRSGREGGTGLGLAISQLLARQIDAALTLDSTGPQGTRFSLSLPIG